jgi:hypothetical protein
MGVHRRDKTARVTSDGPPRVRVQRGEDGKLRMSPDGHVDGVHPETIAEEKPPQGDDPRPAFWRDVGGPYLGA